MRPGIMLISWHCGRSPSPEIRLGDRALSANVAGQGGGAAGSSRAVRTCASGETLEATFKSLQFLCGNRTFAKSWQEIEVLFPYADFHESLVMQQLDRDHPSSS